MKRFNALLFVVPALMLAGCGSDVKKTLGLERSAPDEFAVVERAPLVVPPNFDLVPPTPGAPRPQDTPVSATAQGLILGSQSSAPKPTGSSKAEQSFLQQAGATGSDPNIRQKLATPEKVKKTTTQKLGLTSAADPNKALDPVAEAKKLKQDNVKTVPLADQKKTDDAN